MWDPASKGGVVKYVPLNDDYVYSLTGHVSVAKKIDTQKRTNASENIGIVVEEEQARDREDFEMFNVAED